MFLLRSFTGFQTRASCPDAIDHYIACLNDQDCDACDVEQRRYYELCIGEPGDLVCGPFCAELEVGCTPYTSFGFRGAGCEAMCKDASAEISCLEALYAFDACTPKSGYACTSVDTSCDQNVGRVSTSCGWAPTTPEPSEVTFCETAASEQCRCGLYDGETCETMASQRCLFHVALPLCGDAIETFRVCMENFAVCNRDALRGNCLTEWDAYAVVGTI